MFDPNLLKELNSVELLKEKRVVLSNTFFNRYLDLIKNAKENCIKNIIWETDLNQIIRLQAKLQLIEDLEKILK